MIVGTDAVYSRANTFIYGFLESLWFSGEERERGEHKPPFILFIDLTFYFFMCEVQNAGSELGVVV